MQSVGSTTRGRFNARKLAKQETGLATNDYAALIAGIEARIAEQRAAVTVVAS